MFQQKLSKKMQIYLQIFYIQVLMQTSIAPAFKKGKKESKNNFRPVSILRNVSKVFERCIFRQISDYMGYFLSKYQCGFLRRLQHTTLCFVYV